MFFLRGFGPNLDLNGCRFLFSFFSGFGEEGDDVAGWEERGEELGLSLGLDLGRAVVWCSQINDFWFIIPIRGVVGK